MTARNHHPIFYNFELRSRTGERGYHIDFLGTRTKTRYWKNIRETPISSFIPEYPEDGEQYFEWVSLLESVVFSKNHLTMIDLGAGWGTWAIRAATALRHLNKHSFYLIAVEADITHFFWMTESFKDNDIDPDDHMLINAVIDSQDGEKYFEIAENPSESYGQHVIDVDPVKLERWISANSESTIQAKVFKFELYKPVRLPNGRVAIKTKCVSLKNLLSEVDNVDLIALDIQGAEYDVLQNATENLQHKVKKVQVGTHSENIHSSIENLFSNLNWHCQYNFPYRSKSTTPYGEIQFRDGFQVWVNPISELLPELNEYYKEKEGIALMYSYENSKNNGDFTCTM